MKTSKVISFISFEVKNTILGPKPFLPFPSPKRDNLNIVFSGLVRNFKNISSYFHIIYMFSRKIRI